MAFILNIDTATESASIALSSDGELLGSMENEDQKDHAAWIHSAIQQLMKDHNLTMQQLRAVAVTSGPGSYTGLRVGMSTAKGICYTLRIPLIAESTLKVMALAGIETMKATCGNPPAQLFCPMIDARRMEVFTAVYNSSLQEVVKQQPMVLNESSYAGLLAEGPIIFFGSGSKKFKAFTHHSNAIFVEVRHHARHLARLSSARFKAGKFDDPAYAEPAYLKEFYTHTKK
ncbi:MAG TPA: tRNA (adenosine(37)-N6)-threonylcarbamoyltransferase complex dimerization subunit type 1 TsaB [Chitinophagaceae bacterium]